MYFISISNRGIAMDQRSKLLTYIKEEKEKEVYLQREKLRIESDLNCCRSKQKHYQNQLHMLEFHRKG